jgi:hypothetical protein
MNEPEYSVGDFPDDELDVLADAGDFLNEQEGVTTSSLTHRSIASPITLSGYSKLRQPRWTQKPRFWKQ